MISFTKALIDCCKERNMEYKVRLLQDSTYQVVKLEEDQHKWDDDVEVEHQGNLADCEAYIKLKEGNYM